MAPIGYTTGALKDEDSAVFVERLRDQNNSAVEFSALRESELTSVLDAFLAITPGDFGHVSFHAPSKLERLSEEELVVKLRIVTDRKVNVVVHPDIIHDFHVWKVLGSYLCIENMDQRKPCGRTAKELDELFQKLPEASMCFDFAHAYQIDPTLCEARSMLMRFGNRIREIHLSSLNSECGHEVISYDTVLAFKSIASHIPRNISVILEAPVAAERRLREIDTARRLLEDAFASTDYCGGIWASS